MTNGNGLIIQMGTNFVSSEEHCMCWSEKKEIRTKETPRRTYSKTLERTSGILGLKLPRFLFEDTKFSVHFRGTVRQAQCTSGAESKFQLNETNTIEVNHPICVTVSLTLIVVTRSINVDLFIYSTI